MPLRRATISASSCRDTRVNDMLSKHAAQWILHQPHMLCLCAQVAFQIEEYAERTASNIRSDVCERNDERGAERGERWRGIERDGKGRASERGRRTREGGREGGRVRELEREGGSEGGREVRAGARKGGSERGREGSREEGSGRLLRERERGETMAAHCARPYMCACTAGRSHGEKHI